MKLRLAKTHEVDKAMEIINGAKMHLKQQGINQWQSGYPNYNCIRQDIKGEKGFFIADEDKILGYFCIDYDGDLLIVVWMVNGRTLENMLLFIGWHLRETLVVRA